MTPVFYTPEMNVTGVDSFSPSAGKPARFVNLIQHHDWRAYGHGMGTVTPITREDLYRVHQHKYVDQVFAGQEPNGFGNTDPRVPESCLWTIGSLLAAARYALALPAQPACSPTSGFHHAGYSQGGGYCTFNGLMAVAAKLLSEQPDLKIGILDCDMHYGDGTQGILNRSPALPWSILHRSQGEHFFGNDPSDATDFAAWLVESIGDMNKFGCDLVLYQAGADPHINDPLGGFLNNDQLAARDRTVFSSLNAAITWNLAGGYQESKDGIIFEDPVLEIHRNTLLASDLSVKARQAKLQKASP